MRDRILIVDDDRQLTAFLGRFFEAYGYDATCAGSALEMREALRRGGFALIVLDLILPDGDGFEIARELRRADSTPLIILTARDDVYDRVLGLELGADDYVTKPVEPRELLARVRTVLRRSQHEPPCARRTRRLRFSGLTLDLLDMSLSRDADGRRIPLTGSEFALLRLLAENAGDVLSRERILGLLRGEAQTVTERAVDAHIARIRRKIDPPNAAASLIRTKHGAGYVIAAEVRAEVG